jgi:dynein heavy chain
MIYLEAENLGWQPLMKSWLNNLHESVTVDQTIMLETLFLWVVAPTLEFIQESCREVITTSSQSMVYSLMNLMTCQLDVFKTPNEMEKVPNHIQNVWLTNAFIFAAVWSLGGTLDAKSRKGLDLFLRELISGKHLEFQMPKLVKVEKGFPSGGSIFDYVFEREKKFGGEWKLWIDTIDSYTIPNKARFNSITVPTIDTARYTYLLDLYITHNKQVLIVGPTGTGKSVYINNKLLNGLPKKEYVPVFINFSAQTSANQTQDIILSKLDKRRKGVFGPNVGQKCVIFVDDMNMPAREKYGAQPPIELLRQYMDHGSWFDLKDTSSFQLVNLQFVAAMGPPGGGRNPVTPRFLRHFNTLAISEFDDSTLKNIFSAILSWHFKSNNFSSDIISLIPNIVSAILDIYQGIYFLIYSRYC